MDGPVIERRIAEALYRKGVVGNDSATVDLVMDLMAHVSGDIIDALLLIWGMPELGDKMKADQELIEAALTSDEVVEGVNALFEGVFEGFSKALAARIYVD